MKGRVVTREKEIPYTWHVTHVEEFPSSHPAGVQVGCEMAFFLKPLSPKVMTSERSHKVELSLANYTDFVGWGGAGWLSTCCASIRTGF